MADQTIPQKYLSDHLFLLVGTNPLPNLVAAKLLLKPQGQLYLVHSSATQSVANQLARYWEEVEREKQPQFVTVEESDGADIRRKLQEVLRKISNGQIGLNYTGGTKMMAVHACRVALIDDQGLRKQPFILSYLNARNNTMYIENIDEQPFVSKSLLNAVKPSLRDIIKLHGNWIDPSIADQIKEKLFQLAQALIVTHRSKEGVNAWRNWCKNVLRKRARTKNDNRWDSDKLLKDVKLPLPEDECLGGVVKEMQNLFDVRDGELLLGSSSQRVGLTSPQDLCQWLDGAWLEEYVFSCIKQVQQQHPDSQIHDVGMGITPRNENREPKYEVDIGVMQGYRLYAISCTTDDEAGMCKLKLFEAYIRARNMAGDEAFVALICMVEKPEKLEQQVVRSWDVEGKVRVFGRPHLADLTKDLADWFINTASH
jgi:hypothetical protein